jgi:tetratricopeptide (TPR) repeat protein
VPRRPPTPRLVVALLALAGTLVYLNAIPNAFHFDDTHSIVENPAIRSFRGAGRWFTDASTFTVLKENTNYRPVLLATYAANHALGGLRPAVFRLFNLLGHLGCAILAFLLARELAARLWPRPEDEARRTWVPILTGAIVALHPLQSEIVDYISSRSDGLCALFYLAALYAWVRANAAPARAGLWRAAAVAAFALSLLVKEVGITLPAAIWLWEVLVERRPAVRLGWRRFGRYGLLAAVALAYLGVRAWVLRDYDTRFRSTTPPLEYFATQLHAWFYYLRLFVVPVGQCVDPEYPFSRSFGEPRVLAAIAGVLAVAAAAFVARRRRPEVPFALAFFLVALAPTSSFFPISEAVNEHRPYLANLGLALLAAVALAELAPRLIGRRAAAGLAAAVLVALAALTVARNHVWTDDLTLWRDVVAKAPHNGRAHLNYGLALMARGRNDEALAEYEQCARLWPGYSYCYINRSVLYRQRQDFGRALADLDHAARLTPTLFWVPYFRGYTYQEMGRLADAERAYARALAISPRFAEARYRRARTLADLGRRDEARAEAERAAAMGHAEARRLAEELAK